MPAAIGKLAALIPASEFMSDFPSHPYPWQLQEWQLLSQQIAAKKLPHALMFAGTKGIGKRHLAMSLAQLLLCLSPIEGTPCGKCRGCMLNKVQNHPDLIVISPEEGAKGIKVDQVRALIDDLGKTAQQGGYKVVVLEPAEAMNANAANALLKSLEEPAANTLLVLVCHTPSAVLPTIRSRCQMRLLPTPNSEQVMHWLKPLMVGSNIPITLRAEQIDCILSTIRIGHGLQDRTPRLLIIFSTLSRPTTGMRRPVWRKRWMTLPIFIPTISGDHGN